MVKNGPWPDGQPRPNVVVYLTPQKIRGCLGSPAIGCPTWTLRGRTLRIFPYYPPPMDVALAIDTDWYNRTNTTEKAARISIIDGMFKIL